MPQSELFLTQIAHRIADRRKKLGLTQEALAEQAELSPQLVSYAESGKRATRPENLYKLARALGVSTDYLLSGETVDKDLLLLSEKLQNLSGTQFQAIESIVDECLRLNRQE